MTSATSGAGSPVAGLWIATGTTMAAALSALDLGVPEEVPVLLPGTLSRQDRLAAALRRQLREQGVTTRLLLPAPALSALPGHGRRWTGVSIAPPDRPARHVALPDDLVRATARWVVADVDAVGLRGPWVLDLVARYLHPASRLRMLASRARADAAVDLNLAVPVHRAILAKAFTGFALAATATDPIVGELFALALAEEALPAGRSLQGAWEDRVVQRATELELGIQVPGQVRVYLAGDADEAARAVVQRLTSRIGVRFA